MVSSLLTSTASHLREMGTHRLRASVPTCVGTPPVTDEHRTNCNTRSPRKIQSARYRVLLVGTSLNRLIFVDGLGVIVTHIALLNECYRVRLASLTSEVV